jgi:Fic family protein
MMKRAVVSSDESQRPISVQPLDQSEGKITVNSIENVSLNDKNETKDDLRKYVKMVSPIERSNRSRIAGTQLEIVDPFCRSRRCN